MIILRRLATSAEVTQAAADRVCDLLHAKPHAAIGLATGRTQEPLFSELVRRHHAGQISFRQTRFFHLDEYWGMPATSPDSMSGTLQRLFLNAIDAPDSQFHRVDGMAADPDIEAERPGVPKFPPCATRWKNRSVRNARLRHCAAMAIALWSRTTTPPPG